MQENSEKFPERYRFQLTDEELSDLRFQFETSNQSRTKPFVFNEQVVAMLATVLKTNVTTKVSMSIFDTFIEMHHYLVENQNLITTQDNLNKNK